MRLISSNVLKEGMVIGRTIWNEAGHPLLQKDVVVNARIIERLKQLNIQYVYINDQISSDIEVEETVSPAIRNKTVNNIKKSFNEVRNSKQPAFILEQQSKVIGTIVDDLLNIILNSDEVLTVLTDAYLYDEYLYHHSFQVTLYSIAIAREMGYSMDDLRIIGIGAMLHDIGKLLISTEILSKPGPLSESEFEEMKQHTRYGFDLLRNLHSVSLLVAHCAFQHHERLDGSGYPRGIVEFEIHPFAKIIAVADVFDAMTTNRSYRRKMHPSEAIAIIDKEVHSKYDNRVVEALKKSVVHYPNGTVLLLSDHTRGIVFRQNPLFSAKPFVRIFEKDDAILSATYELSLIEHSHIQIIRVDTDYIVKESIKVY